MSTSNPNTLLYNIISCLTVTQVQSVNPVVGHINWRSSFACRCKKSVPFGLIKGSLYQTHRYCGISCHGPRNKRNGLSGEVAVKTNKDRKLFQVSHFILWIHFHLLMHFKIFCLYIKTPSGLESSLTVPFTKYSKTKFNSEIGWLSYQFQMCSQFPLPPYCETSIKPKLNFFWVVGRWISFYTWQSILVGRPCMIGPITKGPAGDAAYCSVYIKVSTNAFIWGNANMNEEWTRCNFEKSSEVNSWC